MATSSIAAPLLSSSHPGDAAPRIAYGAIAIGTATSAMLVPASPSLGLSPRPGSPHSPRSPHSPGSPGSPRRLPFKTYGRRWLVLALYSMLALMNNFICYTFAPISDISLAYFGPSFPLDWLISVFFITYVIMSFVSSRLVEEKGLRTGVLIGAWCQAVGCIIRCLNIQAPSSDLLRGSASGMVVAGQVIASFGSAFFINPPPLVASTWYAACCVIWSVWKVGGACW